MPETIYYSRINSPVGPLLLAVSERGLLVLEFGRGKIAAGWVESAEKAAPCARQLEEYFSGRRRRFDLPLDLRGTAFQKRCWQELLKIPYGETRSYVTKVIVVEDIPLSAPVPKPGPAPAEAKPPAPAAPAK